MIVSTKGRYALRVMIDLAEHQSEKYVPLKEVAARQRDLGKVSGEHPQGTGAERLSGGAARQGRRLPADPQPGSVHGKRDFDAHRGQPCPGKLPDPGASACARMANCRTYEMWKGLNDLISDYFGKITLADLALPDQAGNDYVI